MCLEAMAAGKPVICLDLGGPAELVTDRTGVKVVANNPEQAVSDLAAGDGVTRDEPGSPAHDGEAGRQRVRDEYIWEKKGDRLDALYAPFFNTTAAPASPSLA